MEQVADPPSLFERIGGDPALDAAVHLFYDKVLADDRIKHFFEGVDMPKQLLKQKAFLAFALGARTGYSGRGMRTAHADAVQRGLNDAHFDAVVELLGATLNELGVASELIAETARIVETTRDDVLGR